MLWIEFTKINEKPFLVNVDTIQTIEASSYDRTDVCLVSGKEVEVQGSYDEILKRLQDLPGSRVGGKS